MEPGTECRVPPTVLAVAQVPLRLAPSVLPGLALAFLAAGCTASSDSSARVTAKHAAIPALSTAHGVLVYVNPLNCKLTSKDIEALAALDSIRGVSTSIVWVLPPGNDSTVVQPLRTALQLTIPDRIDVRNEVRAFAGPLSGQLPATVVIKSRTVRAVFSGDLWWSLAMARHAFTKVD